MSEFVNRDKCKSFYITVGTNLEPLSSAKCSEVEITVRASTDLEIYDNKLTDSKFRYVIKENESRVFKGLTNANEVSAKAVSGTTSFCVRTNTFSPTYPCR